MFDFRVRDTDLLTAEEETRFNDYVIRHALTCLRASDEFAFYLFLQIDNHVCIVPYSQQYINASLTTLDNGMFSCGQNLSLNFNFNSTKYSKR